MLNKLIHKKYYVPNIVKRNLINISNALKNDIEYLYKVISHKYFNQNILDACYMKEYTQRFAMRLAEFKSLIFQFIHYPAFYGLLNAYTELLNKANKQQFCKSRNAVDFSLKKQVIRHFDLIKNQLSYIS